LVSSSIPPFPQTEIIGAMMIVWRVRGKIIRIGEACSAVLLGVYTWKSQYLIFILFHMIKPRRIEYIMSGGLSGQSNSSQGVVTIISQSYPRKMVELFKNRAE